MAQNFPRTYELIRKAAMRMTMRRQFILAAKLLAAQSGQTLNFGASRASSTFDRLLDQATSVPMSELRLQSTLTTNRLDVGPNAALMQHARSSGELLDTFDEPAGGTPSKVSPAGGATAGTDGVPVAPVGQAFIAPTYGKSDAKKKPAHPGLCMSLGHAGAHNGAAEPLQGVTALLSEAAMAGAAKPPPIATKFGGAAAAGGAGGLAQLREELGGAVEGAKHELGAKVDAMQAQLDQLSASVATILERLPTKSA